MRQARWRLRCFTRPWRAQQPRQKNNDQPLPETEPQKCRFIAIAEYHLAYGNDGGRCTGAEACRGQPGGEAAQIRKPFEGVADARAVDRSRADAG